MDCGRQDGDDLGTALAIQDFVRRAQEPGKSLAVLAIADGAAVHVPRIDIALEQQPHDSAAGSWIVQCGIRSAMAFPF